VLTPLRIQLRVALSSLGWWAGMIVARLASAFSPASASPPGGRRYGPINEGKGCRVFRSSAFGTHQFHG
jgi:hypothetical protein